MEKKKVVSAVNFLCTKCGKEHLAVNRTVRADDDKIYFEFACLDCAAVNVVELMASLSQLYTKPFAAGSKLTH